MVYALLLLHRRRLASLTERGLILDLTRTLPDWEWLYVNAQVKSLSPFLRGTNPMTLANNRITLVGALADAAYVTRRAIGV